MKKRLKKTLFVVATFLTITTIFTGCESAKNNDTITDKLAEKYGGSFAIREDYGTKGTWHEFNVYDIAYPDLPFEATLDSDGKLGDYYVNTRVADTFAERVRNVISNDIFVWGRTRTKYTVSTNQNMTPEEFDAENTGNSYIVYIFFDANKYSETAARSEVERTIPTLGNTNGFFIVTLLDSDSLQSVKKYITETGRVDAGYKDIIDNAQSFDIHFENGIKID